MGLLAVCTRASSQTLVVCRVTRAAWRSSTCAAWFTSMVTKAMASSVAIHSSSPACWLSQALNLSMGGDCSCRDGRTGGGRVASAPGWA